METWETIKGRSSIRSYKPDDVSDDTVRALIEMAAQAPSSGNVQNWEFIVVKDQKLKEQLGEISMGRMPLKEAPVIIVVCANQDIISPKYGVRGTELYSVQNTAAAIENLLLAAWDKGLGTCWVGAFSERDVSRILAIPNGIRPLAMVTLGYPAGEVKKPERRDIREFLHYNIYGRKIG